jgi:alpha-ketoglutarate-dependent taurine dioxygenase
LSDRKRVPLGQPGQHFRVLVGGEVSRTTWIDLPEAHDHGSNFGGAWHSDVTYLEQPVLGSILYAREVPDFGGDTLFANMYLAYDALSDGMKCMLDGMTAVHSARRPYGPRSDWFPTQRAMEIRRSNSAQAEVEPRPGARSCSSTAPSRSASAA